MNTWWMIFLSFSSPAFDAGKLETVNAGIQQVYEAVIGEDGQVDYGALKRNDALLEHLAHYMEYISTLDIDAIEDKNLKIAILANTYNVWTLAGVTRAWPVKSVRKIRPLFGFFKKDRWAFAGQEITLDTLENKYLRPLDNRIHFLINCASASCPELVPDVFTSDNVTRLMDENARKFLNDPEKNRFDKEKRRYYISKIFKWFGEDWGGEQGVIDFIKKVRPDLAGWDPAKVVYLDYDWSLNGPTS